MEPLDPATRKAILDTNPEAKAEEIEEYEYLLSQQFRRPPQPGRGPFTASPAVRRLAQLHEKLFGTLKS